MKMSAKQQLFLFRLLQDSISKNITEELSITYAERKVMLDTIIDQQSDKIKEISDDRI